MGDGRHPSDIIVSIAAGAGGGFLALLFTDFALLRAEWCSPTSVDCFREWIGALSGWVAAAAAGLTIVVLIRQTRAAAMQTEFQVGDAFPTAHVTDPPIDSFIRDPFTNRIRIVNWNRHPLLIGAIRIAGESPVSIMEMFVIQDNDNGSRQWGQRFDHDLGRHFVDGWEDRSKPPPVCEIDVALEGPGYVPTGSSRHPMSRHPASFEIAVRIMGNKHRMIVLRADSPDALVF